MAEYTGESLSSEEWEKRFGKLPSGPEPTVPKPSGTETVSQMVNAVTSPTTMFGMSPAEIAGIAAGVTVAGYGAKKAISAIKQRSILKSPETIISEANLAEPFIDVESRSVPQTTQPDYTKPAYQRSGQASPFDIQPAPPVNPAVENRMAQLKERVEAGREAGIGKAPVQTPVQPTAAVQPPVAAPVAQQATTSVTEAVVAGQSPSKAIQTDVAQQLDEASGVAGRVRRTKAQIEQAAAEALANAPEGKLPAAPRKTNKMPGDVIGQGGWHWYEGQMGPQAEKAWLQEFGRTNQPYSRVVEAVKEGRLPVPAPTEGKKGGAFPRQEYVPEYIKGQASLAQLGALAANALGAAGLLQAYKQGKETGDYSDLGLGTIGQILGNIAPKVGLGLSLMAPTEVAPGTVTPIPKTKKEREKLYEERVGAGRGIMPPSMYQR